MKNNFEVKEVNKYLIMDKIPDEILVEIIKLVDPFTRSYLRFVNKKFCSLIKYSDVELVIQDAVKKYLLELDIFEYYGDFLKYDFSNILCDFHIQSVQKIVFKDIKSLSDISVCLQDTVELWEHAECDRSGNLFYMEKCSVFVYDECLFEVIKSFFEYFNIRFSVKEHYDHDDKIREIVFDLKMN
ncbi:MAG: F-box protein [Candidatus Aenigmatarchaeota archaeon]